MQRFIYVLFCVSFVMAQGCQPECSWVCDNPSCDAVCTSQCQPANCTLDCSSGSGPSCGADISSLCSTTCPPDMCALSSCPTCETVCQSILCPQGATCAPLCEPTNCSWDCRAPTNCPRPTCELVCQEPACKYINTSGTRKFSPKLVWMMILALICHIY